MTTDLTNRDRQLIVRMLWTFYLTMLAVAVGFFVGLVVTGRLVFVADGLTACLAAWFVTGPLDEIRREVPS